MEYDDIFIELLCDLRDAIEKRTLAGGDPANQRKRLAAIKKCEATSRKLFRLAYGKIDGFAETRIAEVFKD